MVSRSLDINQDFMALKYTIYNENTQFPIKLVLDIFRKSRKRGKNVSCNCLHILFSYGSGAF